MTRSRNGLFLLLPWVVACATSTGAGNEDPGPAPTGSDLETANALTAPESAALEPATQENRGIFGSRRRRMTEGELALWNSESFQKEFLDSYLSETDIEPTVDAIERDIMQEVMDLLSVDQMQQAAESLERNRDESTSAVLDFTLANIYMQQDRLEDAVSFLEIAVQKHPKFRRAWQNLGVAAFRQGDYEKARPALTQVIQLGGGSGVTYGMLGFCHSSAENDLSAESAYRMAIMLDPATIDWQRHLARTLFKQSRFAEASALCDELIAKHPDRADLWLLQANAYLGQEQPLKAAENYEMADQLGGSTSDSLNNLADIYAMEQLFGAAVDTYLRALNKDKNRDTERSLRAARVLIANGATDESQTLLDGILSTVGEAAEPELQKAVLKLRARIAMAEGAGEEEARVLEEVVSLDPLDGDALVLLGQHSMRSGDIEKAIFYYERAANIEATESLAKLRHGQLLVGESRYKEALPLLRRAQDLSPRDELKAYIDQVERLSQTR